MHDHGVNGSGVVIDWDFARPAYPIEDLAEVVGRQQRNLAALLDGYGPSARQRLCLADAIATQMASHAADLEEMARTDPAFARLVERDDARLARADAEWWVSSGRQVVWRA